MKIKNTTCDMCGKKFDELDAQENFGFHYRNIGYGSCFDESHIDIDLCCDCFDTMMKEYVLPKLQKDKEAYIKDACP